MDTKNISAKLSFGADFRHTSRHGFALVIALSLMAFVLLLLLSITTFVSVEVNNANLTKEQILARENARLGAMIALGKLQKYAGPDQRATALAETDDTADTVSKKWSAIFGTDPNSLQTPVWLVSGDTPNPANTIDSASAQTIFLESQANDPIVVEKEPILDKNNAEAGSFAYWISDQNVKARINLKNETANMSFLTSDETKQDVAEALLQFPGQHKVFDEFRSGGRGRGQSFGPIDKETLNKLATIQTEQQLELIFDPESEFEEIVEAKQHDFSIASMSVLEDSLNGGLKKNLTGMTRIQLDELLEDPVFEDDHYLKGDYLEFHNIDPENGTPFTHNANANSPVFAGSSFNANSELVRIPAIDFYDFQENQVDDDDDTLEPVRNIMPIVSEVSFRMGAFHTQSDTKHRIRFHADVEFWNPYPFPIRFPGESRSRCFTVLLVPSHFGDPLDSDDEEEQLILSVQKMGAGRGRGGGAVEEEIHTNLFDFDEQLGLTGGGQTNNTVDETVMTSWMVIDNVVLQPGEVYHASTEKENGLARDLGGYVLKPGGDPELSKDYIPDTSHDYNKWSWHTTQNPTHPVLEADAEIRIDLRIPENGLTMRLIEFDSRSSSDSPIYEDDESNVWAKPVWELRNIYKVDNPPTHELRGDEYSRSSSGSYTINNYNIGFHFRLADELISGSEPDASDLSLRFDLRQPVWDFDNEAVQSLVDITDDNPFAVSQLANLYDGTDIIADTLTDSHGGGYERAFLYNVPFNQPLSIGSLHRLPLSYETVDYDVDGDGVDDKVQLRVGAPWGDDLNGAFDKYFYTGVPPEDWAPNQPLPVAQLRPSGSTSLEKLRKPDAATSLLFEGGFNVNSTSAVAWSAMLSNTIHDWDYGIGSTIDLKNAFTTLGDATDIAIESAGELKDESDLTNFNPGDPEAAIEAGRLAMLQPLRRLTDAQVDTLADEIVKNIKDAISSNAPFMSVKDFVNSAVLHDAIRESDINREIADFSPAYVSQSMLLEMLAPYLTVRSDTFVIHSVGTVKDPFNQSESSKIRCIMTVQRIPQRVDGNSEMISMPSGEGGNAFGRKFVIVNYRWESEEI